MRFFLRTEDVETVVKVLQQHHREHEARRILAAAREGSYVCIETDALERVKEIANIVGGHIGEEIKRQYIAAKTEDWN